MARRISPQEIRSLRHELRCLRTYRENMEAFFASFPKSAERRDVWLLARAFRAELEGTASKPKSRRRR